MSKNKPYLVFFTKLPDEKDKYHILLSGKETNIYITKHDIMKILSVTQFQDFARDPGIYEIEPRILDPYLKDKQPSKTNDRWKPQ